MSDSNPLQRARLHPLVAGAAAAVIIASGVGIAAITGNLPGSHAEKAEPQAAAQQQPAAAPAPAQRAERARHETKQAHATKQTQVASAEPAREAPRCPACGVVVDVKEVVVKGQGSGVGAVGGAVVGGVVAHEVFDGKNQGLATIAGAAGGALAGNAIEKNVKTKKHYDVAVRMEDGSTKTIAYAEAPAWKPGDKVKVNGATIEPR